MYVALVNLSAGDELTAHFPTEQRFDFALSDPKGNEYWRWSEDRSFGQIEGEVTVPPGKFHLFDLSLEELPMPKNEVQFVSLAGSIVSDSYPFDGTLKLPLEHE